MLIIKKIRFQKSLKRNFGHSQRKPFFYTFAESVMQHSVLYLALSALLFAACQPGSPATVSQPENSPAANNSAANAPSSQPTATATPATSSSAKNMIDKNLPDIATVAFYNVENLYDTINDPRTNDDEFTPGSEINWNQTAYKQKLAQLAKALSSMGTTGPDVFGLVEVENRAVVNDLIHTASLAGRKYAIAHEDSRDERGVDAALVYDTRTWQYVSHSKYQVTLPDRDDHTRDILLTELKSKRNGETVFFLVNHWPSRREGQTESEPNRLAAAKVLRSAVDQILRADTDANIIIMGDFNDDPADVSMTKVVKASLTAMGVNEDDLFNAIASQHLPESRGSLSYNDRWNLFDQLIVSGNLLQRDSKVQYISGSADIFDPEWMQVGFGRGKDNPKRFIFRDKVQKDGFSDHFPVFLKLKLM